MIDLLRDINLEKTDPIAQAAIDMICAAGITEIPDGSFDNLLFRILHRGGAPEEWEIRAVNKLYRWPNKYIVRYADGGEWRTEGTDYVRKAIAFFEGWDDSAILIGRGEGVIARRQRRE